MTLDVKPLDQPVGAIIAGWNPKMALSTAEESVIRDALHDHQVLVFRGHERPTDAALVSFARGFGELVKGSKWFGDIAQRPEILRVNNLIDDEGVPEGTGASEALEWHSDYSYVSTVGKESFLEAVEIPRFNTPQTCFCSQYDAFDRLPRAMVERLRPLSAFHSITSYAVTGDDATREDAPGDDDNDEQDDGSLSAGDDFRDDFKAKKQRNQRLGLSPPEIPEAIHPVILRHPDTGREILYVSKGITRHIIGLPKDESDDLLKELAAHSTRPESVYAHDWQAGDLVMFDTLGTLHRRDGWDRSERRVMRQLSTLWTPQAQPAAG